MTAPGSHGAPSRRQKRMGPAPFASFEDLSDELDSPDEKIDAGSVVRLPGIREDVTPSTPGPQVAALAPPRSVSPQIVYQGISLIGAPPKTTSAAPRIDISRSQPEESRDSTPERELFEGRDKLGLGFREEGALELRSSTEELDFREAKPEASRKDSSGTQRKDSQSSEVMMLSISGRTSRLSSIGSQGSTHSRVSHLSVVSGQSGVSRSPSPHKMLLETSFCGTKLNEDDGSKIDRKEGTKDEQPDELEKVILARKHDPTKAILAEGISVSPKVKKVPEKLIRKEQPSITITIDTPTTTNETKSKLPKTIISKSGVKYTYIPLKGPLPIDPSEDEIKESKSVPSHRKLKEVPQQTERPSTSLGMVSSQPKYIRIKLKPDHLYDSDSHTKPDTLDLSEYVSEKPKPEIGRSISSTPSASPKFARHVLKEQPMGSSKSPSPSLSRKSSFASLFRSKETIASPESPTIPTRRKSTFSGIIRDAGENLRERRRSRSKSRERVLSVAPSSTESIDSKGKKNVFSIFKSSGKKQLDKGKDLDDMGIGSLSNVEFKFRPERCEASGKYHETPLEGDSIRIPLHSPTYYEQKSFLQDLRSSSQGSQETVIENVVNKTEEPNGEEIKKSKKIEELRQDSTSSDNVVFSTRLGSSNELFTTKLPKQKNEEVTIETRPSEKVIIENVENLEEIKRSPSIPKTVSSPNMQELQNLTAVNKIEEITIKKPCSKLKEEDRQNSSESEKDSEIDFLKSKMSDTELVEEKPPEVVEIERKNLVLLQDSFEDELPYIPTTLPQERSVAIPIVPVKQRTTFEIKVKPIERPRSTTPINPSCLEDYCDEITAENVTKTIEKLKISLPREDSLKSPRRPSNNWFDFAEKKIQRRPSETLTQEPPPLPPKGIQKQSWINFEEIPEKRKPPKRIQTIPSRSNIEVPETQHQQQQQQHDNVVYSYVNPEDCKCECHEINARARAKDSSKVKREPSVPEAVAVREDELPLLQDEAAEEDKQEKVGVGRIKLDVTILERRSVRRTNPILLKDRRMPLRSPRNDKVYSFSTITSPFMELTTDCLSNFDCTKASK